MKKYLSLALIVFMSVSGAFAQNREVRNVSSFTKVAFRVPGKMYIRQGNTDKVELEGDKDVLKEIETTVEGSRLVVGREGNWKNWSWSNNEDKIIVYITIKNLEGLNVSGSGDLIGEGKFTARDLDLNVSGSGSLKLDVDASGDVEADVSGSGGINLSGKCRSFNSNVSGSGEVKLDMGITELADFGVSGSGKILASGTASKVKTAISGSGKVLAANLEANSCDIRISGSGDVEINVKNELDANISGSGSVSYKGNPGKVNSHASGSGRVSKM